MAQKIYIISFSDIDDYNEIHHTPRAFANADDAIKTLNEIYEDAESQLPTDWEREKTDTTFEIYLNGEYSCNHYSAWISEVEVK